MTLYPNFTDLIALKKRKWKGKPKFRPVNMPGNHVSFFRGQGLEFDAVRHYVIGDDIRAIDWRVTARTGSPHIKLFQEEREHHHVICIDQNETMRFGTRKTFKSVLAAEVAALLGWRGIQERDHVSACLYGDVRGGVQFFSKGSLYPWLKVLTEPPVESHSINLEKALQHLRQVHSGSIIYVISDFMEINDSLEAVLHAINKKSCLVFIAINDLLDQALYPMGTVGFSHQAENLYIDTNSGNEAYVHDWQSNRNTLRSLTARLKIPLIELTTESDAFRELLKRFSK